MLFKNIGIALTFSPTGKALFAQALRLSKLFNAKLNLIHIGEKTEQNISQIESLIKSFDIKSVQLNKIWEEGEPASTIIKVCENEKIDLLILGALEKENFIKYYVGSVARKLMRSTPCSVMILVNPPEIPNNFHKICVSVNFESNDEKTAKAAFQLAELDNTEELIFIREFQVPGISITVTDNGSVDEIDEVKNQWQKEEESKLDIFISELDIKGERIKKVCLFGKQGWQVSQFAEQNKSDLLILSAPRKKMKLMDRIFQHDLEYIYQDLPCNVLLFRENN